MVPTEFLLNRIATLLGADTLSLAEATPFVALRLARSPFVPGPDLVPADIDESDFDGYGEINAASAATQIYQDPATGDFIIQVNEPAGGWTWETSGITNLPQNINGAYLTNAAGTQILGAELVEGDPVTLNAAGQGFSWPRVTFRLPVDALS